MNECQPIINLSDELRAQRYKTRKATRHIYYGKSSHPNCDSCGFPTAKIECHHHDYTDPEKVSFLCIICHNEYHENSGVTSSYATEFKTRARWLNKNKKISKEYSKYIKEMIIYLEKTTYTERLRPLQFTRKHSLESRWNEAPRKAGRPKLKASEGTK
jgi:hypothetical protein